MTSSGEGQLESGDRRPAESPPGGRPCSGSRPTNLQAAGKSGSDVPGWVLTTPGVVSALRLESNYLAELAP